MLAIDWLLLGNNALYFVSAPIIKTNLIFRDAIHKVHPLSGQGLNLAILSVENLMNSIEDSTKLGYDIGVDFMLENYQMKHFKESLPIAFATPFLNYAFKFQNPIIANARSLGMTLFNRCDPLKVNILFFLIFLTY